jgi:rhodanese-related sulfurtransferase
MDFLSRLFGTPIVQAQPEDVQAKIKNNGSAFLLDVRQPEEYQEGHIQGAKLIPLGELSSRMQELPKNKEIICICRSGNRSGVATRQLSAAGFKAVNMRGGMLAWSRAGMQVKKGGRA